MKRPVHVSIVDPSDGSDWTGWLELATAPNTAHCMSLARVVGNSLKWRDSLPELHQNGLYGLDRRMAALGWRATGHTLGGAGPQYVASSLGAEGECDAILIGDYFQQEAPIAYVSTRAEYCAVASILHRDILKDSGPREIFSIALDADSDLICTLEENTSHCMTERRTMAESFIQINYKGKEGINAWQAFHTHRFIFKILSLISGIDYQISRLSLCRRGEAFFSGPHLLATPEKGLLDRPRPYARCQLSPAQLAEVLKCCILNMRRLYDDALTILDNLGEDRRAEEILYWLIPILDRESRKLLSEPEQSLLDLRDRFFGYMDEHAPQELRDFSRKHLKVKDMKPPSLRQLIERYEAILRDEGYPIVPNAAKVINDARNPLFHGSTRPDLDLADAARCVSVMIVLMLLRAIGVPPHAINEI